jgi:hypothetical protein
MSIVRRDDSPVLVCGPRLPTLQRLGDRASGSDAVTVFINTFTSGEAVPEHTHEVEEVLLVTVGECAVTVDGRPRTVDMYAIGCPVLIRGVPGGEGRLPGR